MKILHTADWHIGQLFHEYDRTYEHQQFLNWLVKTLHEEKLDVLLISGDVFDLSNPSAASIKMFYTFLNKAVKLNPALQIIITAGNHDSASRLESPKPLLESSNIHIIGVVEKDANGNIDYKKMIIPLKDKNGNI
ncbi:MAG: exonuclease subunit SbcD, partial [Ginsengibacter sp.]